MFAMVAVTCSIVCSVIVLNIYHKKDVSTNFPKWLNVILFDVLPRYMIILPTIVEFNSENQGGFLSRAQ